MLPSACSEGTWAAPVGARQTSVPAATAANLFVSRLQSGHAASDSRARRGAAGRAPGNLPRTARRARRRGSRASRRRGLARPESTAQLGYAEAAWSASRSFSTCRRDQRVRPCVSVFAFGGLGESERGFRHGCGYRAVYFRRNFRPLLLRSLAHNDSRLPRNPDTLERACSSV